MRIKQSRTGLVAAALVAAVALTACGDAEELAETSTELTDEDRLAQLEAQLDELRADDADEVSAEEVDRADDGEDTDTGEDEGAADDIGDDEADRDGAAAAAQFAAERNVEPRVVEVGETFTDDDGPFTLTVERLIIHDYYIEIEVTAVNDHPQTRRRIWNNSNLSRPMLFDELDGRFTYQHVAGYNTNQAVELQPGERLDAVMVFGGRLRPEVEELTLLFRGSTSLLAWELTVPVGQVQP